MVEQELINYIQTTRAQGFSDEDIKSALIQAGWDRQEIEAGFAQLTDKTQAPAKSRGFFRRYKKLLLVSAAILVAIPLFTLGGLYVYQIVSQPGEETASQKASEEELRKQEEAQAELEKQREAERAEKRDEQRLKDIARLQSLLQIYFETHEQYPAALELLTEERLTNELPADPKTNGSYLYTPLGDPRTTYSLSFILETDIGTLRSGLMSVSSENLLDPEAVIKEGETVRGSLSENLLPLQITDLSSTSFYPGEEVTLRVETSVQGRLQSAVLAAAGLKLTDRTPPFAFSFSAPAEPGIYHLEVFGFGADGGSFAGKTTLTVK